MSRDSARLPRRPVPRQLWEQDRSPHCGRGCPGTEEAGVPPCSHEPSSDTHLASLGLSFLNCQ